MGEHWQQARVFAELIPSHHVTVKTKNVTDLTLSMPPGQSPFDLRQPVLVQIDGQSLTAPRPKSDRSWSCRLYRASDGWQIGTPAGDGLRKQHNLQGPIDDAFMDSFLFVRPSHRSRNARLQKWAEGELHHARDHWRRQFRGDARVKNDDDVTDDDIASSNLVLWGDPSSNGLLARIADRLPIHWTDREILAGDHHYSTDHHALILVYPNPLNPARYVVLNSGFTNREFAYLNNARQIPMLPDWAVVDLRSPPNSQFPGKIVDADFFGERWQLRPRRRSPK